MRFEIVMQWRDEDGLHVSVVGEFFTMKRAHERQKQLTADNPSRLYWVQRKSK